MQGTIEGRAAPDVDEDRYDTDEVHRTAQRRRRLEHGIIAALVVVVLAAVALVGFVGGSDENEDREADRASGAAPVTTETTVAPTTAPPADQEAPAPAAPAQPNGQTHEHESAVVLADGRHPVYITGVDTAGRMLELDLVQWLTDEQADQYVRDHPDLYPGMYEEYGGYVHDEIVLNENPRLRTLPVVANAQVVVLRTATSDHEPNTIDFADLPAYFTEFPASDDPGRLSNNVFWLTVEDGEIVAVEEQFQS